MDEQQIKILCVDDERNVLRALRRLFLDEEYEILTAESAEEGLEILAENSDIQLVISDYRMPGMNGVEFLRKVYEQWPMIMRVVLSGYADTAAVVSAINEGQIYRFIPKPWDDDDLKDVVVKALEIQNLQAKNLELTRALQNSNEELKTLNENLEQLVEERTAELVFQNRVLAISQNVLDSLPVAVIGLDSNGLIVQCNRMGMELLAGESGGLMGRTGKDVLPADMCAFFQEMNGPNSPVARIELSGKSVIIMGSKILDIEGQHGALLVLVPEEGF